MFAAILAFAGVGIHTVGFLNDLPAGVEIGGAPPPTRQLWPPRSPMVTFPPPTIDNRLLRWFLRFAPLRPQTNSAQAD